MHLQNIQDIFIEAEQKPDFKSSVSQNAFIGLQQKLGLGDRGGQIYLGVLGLNKGHFLEGGT